MAAYESNASLVAVSSSTNALQSPISPRRNKPRPLEDLFPSKLYEMLEEVETLGLSAAVSWQPHGRAFVIKDKELFMTHVVPHFFKATKIRSFQRQCHLWGYKRIPTGPDVGAWWHESFVRGRPQDLKHIVRTRVKGTASSMAHVPNFYEDNANSRKKAPSMEISTSEMGCFVGKAEETSSLSASNSSSDKDEEFEHLDEEFEALFHETSPRHVSMNSSHNTAKEKYSFDGDFPLHIPNLNCNSNNGWNLTLKKKETNWNLAPMTNTGVFFPKLSSTMGQNASLNQPFPYYYSSFSNPTPQQGAYKPGPAPMSCGRDNEASGQEDVDAVDEFSKFIDEMIQLP